MNAYKRHSAPTSSSTMTLSLTEYSITVKEKKKTKSWKNVEPQQFWMMKNIITSKLNKTSPSEVLRTFMTQAQQI